MLRMKTYFAVISYEINFQCRDILIFNFAYLLKLKTRGRLVFSFDDYHVLTIRANAYGDM